MSDKILLINDLPGYGKVALAAMIPVLSHMGFDLYNLPTALISNTFDYGKFEVLETTEYMKNTISVWKELGFNFDGISTGFIMSEEQVKLVADYCQEQSQKGTIVFVDPIMGDDGKLYNGVTNQTIEYMRQLCSVADYIVPNYTEAAFLAGVDIKNEGISLEEGYELIDRLRELGSKSIVITSVNLKDNTAVLGYDSKEDTYFSLSFEYVAVRFPGTGDIFSSVMMGKVLLGAPLQDSAQKAMDYVKDIIILSKDSVDKFKGIPIEAWLDKMDI